LATPCRLAALPWLPQQSPRSTPTTTTNTITTTPSTRFVCLSLVFAFLTSLQNAAPAKSASSGLEMLSFLDAPVAASAAPALVPASSGSVAAPALQQLPPYGGLAQLNLGAPTLQAGPTLVAPQQPPMSYGGFYAQPTQPAAYYQPVYYAQPPPGMMMAPQGMQQPPPQLASQPRSPFAAATPPPPANDSFSFVQSVVQTEKKNVVK
jgi:hypothetical protein